MPLRARSASTRRRKKGAKKAAQPHRAASTRGRAASAGPVRRLSPHVTREERDARRQSRAVPGPGSYRVVDVSVVKRGAVAFAFGGRLASAPRMRDSVGGSPVAPNQYTIPSTFSPKRATRRETAGFGVTSRDDFRRLADVEVAAVPFSDTPAPGTYSPTLPPTPGGRFSALERPTNVLPSAGNPGPGQYTQTSPKIRVGHSGEKAVHVATPVGDRIRGGAVQTSKRFLDAKPAGTDTTRMAAKLETTVSGRPATSNIRRVVALPFAARPALNVHVTNDGYAVLRSAADGGSPGPGHYTGPLASPVAVSPSSGKPRKKKTTFGVDQRFRDARARSPGPAIALPSSLGLQASSSFKSSSRAAFGKSSRDGPRPSTAAPGPGAYNYHTARLRATAAAAHSVPRSSRDAADRLYEGFGYGDGDANAPAAGRGVPGPGEYNHKSFVDGSATGGRILASARVDVAEERKRRDLANVGPGTHIGEAKRKPPTVLFGTGTRDTKAVAPDMLPAPCGSPDTPGPGTYAHPSGSTGKLGVVSTQRSSPAFGFGASMTREQRDILATPDGPPPRPKAATPGSGTYSPVVGAVRRSAPRFVFGTSERPDPSENL